MRIFNLPSPLLACALLSACRPWQAVVDREAVWWEAARIPSEAGVRLIDVQHGLPVGYWPRAVLRADGTIDLDNRAWMLSLPQAAYDALSPEEIEGLLIERTGLHAAPDDPTGHRFFLPDLHAAAQEHREIHRALAARLDIPPLGGEVVLLPEPGVPTEAVMAALYSLAQAELDAHALAGREGDHLRYVNAAGPDADACAMRAFLSLTAAPPRIHLSSPRVPPLAAPDCGPAEPAVLIEALSALVRRCTGLWSAAQAQPLHGRPPWACATLNTATTETSAEVLLQALSAIQGAAPTVQHQFLAIAVDSSPPLCPEVLPAAEDLTLAQLAEVCDAAALGQPHHIAPACATEASRAAFPAWSATLPDCTDSLKTFSLKTLAEELQQHLDDADALRLGDLLGPETSP